MDRAPIDLTDEERAIVALLAQGHTANRIAATTELGPRSVVRRILVCRQKLDARNNAELVAKAVHLGLHLVRPTGKPAMERSPLD